MSDKEINVIKALKSDKEIYNLKELSIRYGVSYSRLTKATMDREFPYYKQGKVFVMKSDFLNWLTANKVDSSESIRNKSAISA